jgi:S-adenosylmethionine synthetase
VARSNYVFTSESVSEGHPDKVADRISDTVVDAFIGADPEARVACETMVTTNRIIIGGEVRAGKPGNDKAANKAFTKEIIASLQPKIRAAVKDIGYEQKGFHWEKAKYAQLLARPIRAHRTRRRRYCEEGRRRRRPRHHVRLRVQ